MISKDKEYVTKITDLENGIKQLEKDIKDNDKQDTKRRRVVVGVIIGSFLMHMIGLFTNPFISLAALIILLTDTITGWIVLSKFETKDEQLKAELESTKQQLENKKEEYENFLEEEYRQYSRPRINPTIVETPVHTNNNNIKKYTNNR